MVKKAEDRGVVSKARVSPCRRKSHYLAVAFFEQTKTIQKKSQFFSRVECMVREWKIRVSAYIAKTNLSSFCSGPHQRLLCVFLDLSLLLFRSFYNFSATTSESTITTSQRSLGNYCNDEDRVIVDPGPIQFHTL